MRNSAKRKELRLAYQLRIHIGDIRGPLAFKESKDVRVLGDDRGGEGAIERNRLGVLLLSIRNIIGKCDEISAGEW